MTIYSFGFAAHGVGISGGDRIHMELVRRWSKRSRMNVFLWTEGMNMFKKNKVPRLGVKYKVSDMDPWYKFGFFVNYFARIATGIRWGLTLELKNLKSEYLYSASDFWMDVIPCVILKIRYRKVKWICGWYQTAPNPIKGYEMGRYRLSALAYFLSQLPIKPIVRLFADYVFVNNESERKQFDKLNSKNKVFVFIGAVDLELIDSWKRKFKRSSKKYDAVFQGRFHPQKGVVELVNIWKQVVVKVPNARLAMIGDGPLMENVKSQISNFQLENNIKLFGYLFDGTAKYELFSQSKVVVHPAFYDSGGMASAEAMAFGMPCIGFDLAAYKSYYPKGMVKVKSEKGFSKMIVKLLKNQKLRQKIGKEAKDVVYKNYSWDKRARDAMEFLNG